MITWCYIACFIDTDGSVGVYMQKQKSYYKGKLYKGIYKRVRISFFNDDKNVLELIKKFIKYKGKVSPKATRENGKVGYALYINNHELTKKILKQCIPFMIIKKAKAKECFDFLNSIT